MRIRSCIALLTVALLGGCAAGNQGAATKGATPAAHLPASKTIWEVSQTPYPIDIVVLAPGEKSIVKLASSVTPGPFSPASYSSVGAELATVNLKGNTLEITGVKPGRTLIDVVGKDATGTERKICVPLVIEPMPQRDFAFDPKGKKVESVALAGEFNGWSSDRDPFTKDADGIFRLKKALAPGKYNYKLVIDGAWVADPSNPVQDTSGYGNSVLEVDGKGRDKFAFTPLAAAIPGAGSQFGFHANLADGDKLVPEKVAVIVNNERVPNGQIEVDVASSTVRLKVDAAKWTKENFVTVFGYTEKGASGEILVPVAYADAPRSPRDEVIYFAMTDRFKDGNPALNKPAANPDLTPLANYQGGDWAGIKQKIEEGYFDKLGVSTIWVSPLNKNTDKVEKDALPPHRLFTSYHGYWPISLTETNEQFGSMDDLKALVATAHEHGIAVLFDFVANHVHEDHPLFKANPSIAAPIKLADGSNNIREFDKYPLTTWFDTFLPDLDYDHNPEILKTMTDNAAWWIKETGADGFRHDAVKHVPTSFWQMTTEKLNKEIVEKEHRRLYQVGETISGPDTIVRYIGPDMMDGQFDFPTYFALQGVLARGTGSMKDLGTTVRNISRYYPAGSIMSPLIGNHDVSRFMAHADGDLNGNIDNEKELGYKNPPKVDHPSSYKKLQLAFAFMASLPGAPTIYYGDEMGQTGAADPDNRRPFKWEGWTKDEQKTFDIVSAINKVRHESVALRRGAVVVLAEEPERLVIARVAPEEVVIVSLSRKPENSSTTIALPGGWASPKGLTPLVVSGQKAIATKSGIALKDKAQSFGIWKVEW